MKKRFLSLLLLVLLLAAMLCTPALALTESEVEAEVAASGRATVTGNVLIWFLCAVAFLKVSQKIDSFMASMGVNVGRTGGSLMSEAMIAAKGVSMLVKAGGGAIGGIGKAVSGPSGGAASGPAGSPGSSSGFFKGGIIGMAGRHITNSAVRTATSRTAAVHTAQKQSAAATSHTASTIHSSGNTNTNTAKTVYVQPGKTIEIRWENTPITGQIQVLKYSADYNEITGTPAGAPLQGAVYEISEARSGKVVAYITTDVRGVAASEPLPLGRYKICEVTAPAYYQLDPMVFDETLEYSGQIIRLSAYDKPVALGVSITKRGNYQVLARSQMRYDFTVANTSNVPLENFYWHERIPTDATRATVFTTGTYSARLNYRILYKTNYTTDYKVLASNLNTASNYSFGLNAIPLQAGEVVTDIYLEFGKVPVGFQSKANPTLTVQVLGTVANGYQIINRADVGGKYQGTWQTAQASWVTIVRKLTTTPTLPKTGY